MSRRQCCIAGVLGPILHRVVDSLTMCCNLPVAAQVIEQAQIEEMGMGLYLGVSACSDLPPKLIHLTYTPPGTALLMRCMHLDQTYNQPTHFC